MNKELATLFAIALLLFWYISPLTAVAVNGDSMEPTIPEGSLQIIYESKEAEVNDVIVYYSSFVDEIITHRIVDENQDGFITQGDNNEVTDQSAGHSYVQDSEIIGKSITVFDQPIYIPYIGFILLSFGDNIVLLSGVILLLLLTSSTLLDIRGKSDSSMLVIGDILNSLFMATILLLTCLIILSVSSVGVPLSYTDTDSLSERQYVVDIDNQNQIQEITISKAKGSGQEIYKVDNADIISSSRTESTITLEVIPPERESQGVEELQVDIYQFPPFIPENLILSLLDVSVFLAALLSSILVTSPLYIFYNIFGDLNQPINQPTSRRINKLLKRIE